MGNIMKGSLRRIGATFIAFAVLCSTCLWPSLHVLAAPKMMAHLKSGSGNANGHFGSQTPEAFVLSDKNDITNETIKFQMKLASTKSDTRFRFVTKYVDDTHWSYIAYDGASGWFIEYKNGSATGYPSITGLPELNQNDMVNVSAEYIDNGLALKVENKTSGKSGEALIDTADFISLKNQKGKIGFGAGTYQSQLTEIYFSDVVVGSTNYTNYSQWALYKQNLAGQTWEPSVAAPGTEEETPVEQGRKWFTITGGANNAAGHAYGDATKKAPILLLDNDKKMEDAGSLSLKVKPSNNWGVFYNYVNDANWLYVGYDSSSNWYYQYNLDGSGSYPKITGLPEPVEGQALDISISLSRETLSVTVNGVTSRVTNQSLISFAEKNSGKGRFGVKTSGATSISFADVKYNGINCMEDNWVFAAERQGQLKAESYSKLAPVSGVVSNKEGKAISEAVVRIGTKSVNTDINGHYQLNDLEVGGNNISVTKPGYQAYSKAITIEDKNNVVNIILEENAPLDLTKYDNITSDTMKVYIGKNFPVVARYNMIENNVEVKDKYFIGNETDLNTVVINGVTIKPTVTVEESGKDYRIYGMNVQNNNINFNMKVKISVEDNNLTWKIVDLKKAEGSDKIATIDIPQLNLVTVNSAQEGANFAGAKASTTTTVSGDVFINFKNGFVPSQSDSYLYGILTNNNLSAGIYSNSEAEGDKRIVRNNGGDTMSLTSSPWYYELGDKRAQGVAKSYAAYPVSELPFVKVSIGEDENEDGDIDWNDGALAFRKIMNVPYGSEVVKDMVNQRIVMNFASMASNPYLTTADNIKKVYLATDGLPQSIILKGYGNEGHDSANSEYADIAEREGGVGDFQDLIKIAHDYNTEIGIHINAQEAYPEAASFNEEMLQKPIGNGWGWLDQSHVIDKLWDLSSQGRWKRLVQLYDRINGTNFYNREWPLAVENSKGEVTATKEQIKADAESRPNNMDFIYLDVWYQDSWETRNVVKEINSLGWRFTTEFSATGEHDSTWQHWSTDAKYGGAAAKGLNSEIIRFIRNDQRDSQVLNHPEFKGTADNPLLGGYRLYGFEGWGGDKNYNNYILQTFNQNLPTKFLQHYYVIDWENYEEGKSPVGNKEKQITLKNDAGDKVVVTRKEQQRSDENIERIITLNGKKVLDDVTYLLPWIDEDGSEKLYHWNLDGGKTTWELPKGWNNLGNVVMYELSDQGRINEVSVPVNNGSISLDSKAATAYILVKGAEIKELKNNFGEADYVVDPGFNGYAAGEKLSSDNWSGDINNKSIVIEKANTGDQRLAFNSPSDDLSVKTIISGLKPNTNYVAEVYVENNSDAKATIEVNSGSRRISNYAGRSILNNYVQSDQKNGSKMQRMQISFVAEKTTAELTLGRALGEGSTYIDDIRIVEKKLNNFQNDGVFKQDFETVVQGLYPFVLSSAQGISDPVTHLSQLHEPYTQAGWNGRVIDDVISGNWSLKHHGANTGIIYQTLPQNFRFEAGKVYNVEFDYQSGPDKAYAMVVGEGTNYTTPTAEQYLAQARGDSKHVKMQVIGSGSGQTWIGLYENGSKAGSGAMGQTDFVLDNLVITEDKDAVAVTLSALNLYKGETSTIYGSSLNKINWTSSNENVAVVDKDANVVKALSAGNSTITATLPDGKKVVFEIKIIDDVAMDIPRSELTNISSIANTEEKTGEPAGSGVASAATDGNSSTYWHSNWSTGGFVVSETNPAILTVDLGKEINIGGFKFQQRPSANNGIVQKFKYEVLDSKGSVLESSEAITVSDAQRRGGEFITSKFKNTVSAKTIKIYVLQGNGNFAVISEVAPITLQKVADTATLENVTINLGEKITLTATSPENTILKGIVWTSSDETVATVNQNGTLTALKKGTAKIKITNAAGLEAESTVTIKDNKLIYTELEDAIEEAEKLDLTKYIDGAEKNEFVKALEDAKSIIKNASSQEEVNKATENLIKAQSSLKLIEVEDPETPVEVDRRKLESVINEAEKLDLTKYIDGAEKNAFVKALEDAKAIIENASSQEEVNKAAENLVKAQSSLKLIEVKDPENPVEVDRSKLESVINEAEKLDLTKYVDGAEKNEFVKALEDAKAIVKNASTQEAVDNALSKLNASKDKLVVVEEPQESNVDKSKLDKFYKECLVYYKEINHSKENWTKYQDILKEVEKVINNKNASEKEVDEVLKSLINITRTMNNELKAPNNNGNNGSGSNNGNPGGNSNSGNTNNSGNNNSNNNVSNNNTSNPPVAPKTQDSTNSSILILGLVFSMLAIGGITLKRKRKVSKEVM